MVLCDLGGRWLWSSKPMGSHFGGFSEFTTHFRTYFSGWIGDVHWGLTDLDFEKPMARFLGYFIARTIQWTGAKLPLRHGS